MKDDIVTRLRDYLAIVDHAFVWNELSDAADEIERLQAEIVRLRGVVVLCPKCYEAEHGEGAWARAVRGE